MASITEQLHHRYEQLSPAMRFGVIGMVFIIGFLIWEQTVFVQQEAWSARADVIERDLARVSNMTELRDNLDSVKSAVYSFGAVEPPTNAATAKADLEETVNQLLRKYEGDITDDSFNSNRSERLPKDALASLLSAGEIGQRHVYMLEFIASPQVTTEILEALEASPAIESISTIRLKRDTGKRLSVRLEMECWSRANRPRPTAP